MIMVGFMFLFGNVVSCINPFPAEPRSDLPLQNGVDPDKLASEEAN